MKYLPSFQFTVECHIYLTPVYSDCLQVLVLIKNFTLFFCLRKLKLMNDVKISNCVCISVQVTCLVVSVYVV